MRLTGRPLLIALTAGVTIAWPVVRAGTQAPAGPYAPRQSDRPSAIAGDEPGFEPIFDGRTLNGWDGGESAGRRAAWRPGSCGAADEGGIPEHPDQALVKTARHGPGRPLANE